MKVLGHTEGLGSVQWEGGRKYLVADHWEGLTGSTGDPLCWRALARQPPCSTRWSNQFDAKALLGNRGPCSSDRLSWMILIIDLIPIFYCFASLLEADIGFQSGDTHSLPPQKLPPLMGRGRQSRAVRAGDGPSLC